MDIFHNIEKKKYYLMAVLFFPRPNSFRVIRETRGKHSENIGKRRGKKGENNGKTRGK